MRLNESHFQTQQDFMVSRKGKAFLSFSLMETRHHKKGARRKQRNKKEAFIKGLLKKP